MSVTRLALTLPLIVLVACSRGADPVGIRPVASTAPVADDADDPAIWFNPADPMASLIIGTNKVQAPDGALYVFGLDGAIRQVVSPLDRPNNVDVEYGLATPAGQIDIVVTTERRRGRLRVYRVGPDGLAPIDGEGIPVLVGETGDAAQPMGIALYRRPGDGAVFAIVAPKSGGTSNYLWQYRLIADSSTGSVRGELVRRFGSYSGSGEIEAVVADDPLGYVYYADEEHALHKWHADPDHVDAERELAVFGRDGYEAQREGLAVLARPDGTGFIINSDQIAGGTKLRVYRREGREGRPHDHDPAVAVIPTMADSTDGLEITSTPLGDRFPAGVLVMMSSRERTFQLYDVRDVVARLPR